MVTLKRTCGANIGSQPQVAGCAPISLRSRRISQKRCGTAEFKVGPKPTLPIESGSVAMQAVEEFRLKRKDFTNSLPSLHEL